MLKNFNCVVWCVAFITGLKPERVLRRANRLLNKNVQREGVKAAEVYDILQSYGFQFLHPTTEQFEEMRDTLVCKVETWRRIKANSPVIVFTKGGSPGDRRSHHASIATRLGIKDCASNRRWHRPTEFIGGTRLHWVIAPYRWYADTYLLPDSDEGVYALVEGDTPNG